MNKLLFFCFALAVLLFSIIVINISPIIKGLYSGDIDYDHSCKYYSDQYDYDKENNGNDETLDFDKRKLNRCNRIHAMTGLEYTSLNVNLLIGFVCALLGLLVYLNIIEDKGKVAGLIGLGGGVVGFVLTLVYVIYSGLIFDDRAENETSFSSPTTSEIKIDSDGAFLKWDSSKNTYTCIFYEKDNVNSIYLSYSDYGSKYLSYNKDHFFNQDSKTKHTSDSGCNLYSPSSSSPSFTGVSWSDCKSAEEGGSTTISTLSTYSSRCEKLYFINTDDPTNEKKIIYDKWLTSIILSCFIFLFDIGLAIFGFLLFRSSYSTI